MGWAPPKHEGERPARHHDAGTDDDGIEVELGEHDHRGREAEHGQDGHAPDRKWYAEGPPEGRLAEAEDDDRRIDRQEQYLHQCFDA